MSNSHDKPGVEKYLLVLLVAGLAGFSLYLYLRAEAVRGRHSFNCVVWAMYISWAGILFGAGTLLLVRRIRILLVIAAIALAIALFVGIYIPVFIPVFID